MPSRQRQPWTNWAQTVQCTPALTVYPASVDDLIAIVHFARAAGRTLRVAASGHSWSALVPTEDVLVCTHRLNRVAMDLSDAAHPRVSVESGATVEQVNAVLEAQGYALPLNVVLESVRFGGLVATGSHGSGWNNPTLSDLVHSIEMVSASGEVRTFTAGVDSDEIMQAARLTLGMCGIIWRMTLDVQKTWQVRAVDQRLPIDHVLERLPEWVPAHANLDLFWWAFADQLWVKTWDPTDAAITARPRQRVLSRLSEHAGTRALAASLRALDVFPRLTPAFCRAAFRATPSQQERVVEIVEAIHYRRGIETAKMGCVEIAFTPDTAFANVQWAIRLVMEMTNAYAARGEYPMNVTLNVRFIGSSACWLSPAFGDGDGHTCYIEILSSARNHGWAQFSGEVARQWLQLPHARPHWAKEFRHIPGVIEHIRRELGPNIARFNQIKERLQVDPAHMFVNRALKEIFL
jgi:FAD/FMN-containing dehydrogenase